MKKYKVWWLSLRLIKQINRALNITLYKWQKKYIFGNGEYHDEARFGRYNGKTLANVLKFLFSSGPHVVFDRHCLVFDESDLYLFAREDAGTISRLRFFTLEVLRIYKILEAAGVHMTRKIIFR
jgi:hypothetical protein